MRFPFYKGTTQAVTNKSGKVPVAMLESVICYNNFSRYVTFSLRRDTDTPSHPGEVSPLSKFPCRSMSCSVTVCRVKSEFVLFPLSLKNSVTSSYAFNQLRPDLTKERGKVVAYPMYDSFRSRDIRIVEILVN